MRIEEDMKLDFKDVLFRPKRSTLRSRSEVDLNRTFTFRNSKKRGLACRSWRRTWIRSAVLKSLTF